MVDTPVSPSPMTAFPEAQKRLTLRLVQGALEAPARLKNWPRLTHCEAPWCSPHA